MGDRMQMACHPAGADARVRAVWQGFRWSWATHAEKRNAQGTCGPHEIAWSCVWEMETVSVGVSHHELINSTPRTIEESRAAL